MNPLEQLPQFQVFSDPKSETEIFNNDGVEECLNNNYEEGIAHFNDAIRLNPNNRLAAFNRGIAQIRYGYIKALRGHARIRIGMNELAKLPERSRPYLDHSLDEWASSFQDHFGNLPYLD